MMPISRIVAASDPEVGPVKPKQGTSLPLAKRGRYCSTCSGVPYFSISSPGPNEFGTMMMTETSGEREATLPKMRD